jgi:hypothetical protein
MSALAPSGPERRESPAPARVPSDIDCRHPVLGNPFVLHDHRDATARAEVMELYRAQLEDVCETTARWRLRRERSQRVLEGERLVLMCWCWPKPCHGNLSISEINRRLRSERDKSPSSDACSHQKQSP